MKKSVRIWSSALALALAMGIPAQAAEENPVLFTFNGKEIHQDEVVQRTAAYAQSGFISSDVAYEEAIEYMIADQLVAEAKAAELGLDQFTDAELEALKAEAAVYFEQQLDAVVEYFAEGLSEEDKATFREELIASWAEIGTTVESAEKAQIFNATKERLLETMEVEITDEEIQAVYDEQVAKDKEYFEGNIIAFEYFTYYQDYDVWYVPTGFRSVLQIMLNVDEELTDAYEAAKKENAGMEEARAAILASQQETIDEIYARIEAGEDFVALMNEYSQDPSLSAELAESGYSVHRDSTVFGKEFAEGAFSDKMQQVGDVSDPIVSKYGVQILYYLRDIEDGPVSMSDAIRASITTYLTNQKRIAMLDAWAADYEVSYNQEAIDALVETAETVAQ